MRGRTCVCVCVRIGLPTWTCMWTGTWTCINKCNLALGGWCWADFFVGTGCSGTIAQRCHMRVSLHHLSLLTLYITFIPRAWKCSFLVLMGMWGNRKINILSFLWQTRRRWSQKHRPCSFATALSFEFHLWRAINWIIEKLLFVAWNQWSSKGVKVKES